MRVAPASPVDRLGTSLILAGAMCVIPFLQPRHFSPIRTFYDEWLALALGLAAVGLASLRGSGREFRIPALSAWLALFALILVVRGFSGHAAYPQLPFLWALYALFAALLVILGHGFATQFGQERVADVLAAFVLVGALGNAIAGVLQVTGIPQSIDAFISYLHGKRAIGNVGQPNLYANYLALGEASLAYLYARGKVGLPAAAAAGLLLLLAAALAASRSYLLFLGYFVLLGWIALRRYENTFGRRLCTVTIALAIAGSLLQSLVPALLEAAGFSIERAALSADWTSDVDPSTGLRLLVWQLAWELFAAAPWNGVGPGEFAGAGFVHGLPIGLANGEIWNSAHNLVLQLLAETGSIGAIPVAAGLLSWAAQSKSELWRAQSPAMWWILACVGVEIMHAMLEYPLSYAHFLALAALLMGVGADGGLAIRPNVMRAALAASALAGAYVLASTVYDYARFDLAIAASGGHSLAPESQAIGDRATLRRLRAGLLAPRIELTLFLALPLDRDGLDEKIAIGERVLRIWPSSQAVSRQSIFLALAERKEEAIALLTQGLKTSGKERKKIAAIIAEAPPTARAILLPVLGKSMPLVPPA